MGGEGGGLVGEVCRSLRHTEKTKMEKIPLPTPPIEKKEDYRQAICHNPALSRPQSTRTIVNIEHSDILQDEPPQPEKKKAGRPKGTFGLKRQIQEYARNPALALPKTDHQRLKELKDMLIKSSGKDVVEKMISIALNDDHPAQMAAIKMCVDRTLPVSMFEKDKSQRSAVNITISGIGGVEIGASSVNTVDVEDIEAKNG